MESTLQTFSTAIKDWESNFFGFNFATLNVDAGIDINHFFEDYEKYKSELSQLLANADKDFELLEAIVDTRISFVMPLLEDLGFRFVDSKISFLTPFEKSNIQGQIFEVQNSKIKIREKVEADYKAISDLSINFMVHDKLFVSKYKNKLFFAPDLAEKYFREWIKNTFKSENAIISVAVNELDEVIGFFIYEKKGTHKDIPVYKGILTVVNPAYRGSDTHLSLQSFIFNKIADEKFYIDNTTQVTNVPIIRNHIKSDRYLNNISFILLRKKVA